MTALPLIGVTCSRQPSRSGFPLISVAEAYVRALVQAGACPLLVPLGLTEQALATLLPVLNGLLFTGGGDIAPEYYSAGPHSRISEVDLDRDRVELYLLERAAGEGLPFLGICRGFQLVNVALGGTLYADIADQHPGAGKHDYFPGWPRDHLAHPVQLRLNCRLARIFGQESLQVNSLHHQGIRDLAPGLSADGWAPDGLQEAVELSGHPFGLAVQWHPEWLTEHAPMRALFRAFVQAAGQ